MTKDEIVKAQRFCAYQERSQQEVRNKLYELGLFAGRVEEVISELIQAGFLNEERFAVAYTLGKFRIKKWGKLKIRHGLRLKKIPEKLIAKALKQINEADYLRTLQDVLSKKRVLLKEKDNFKLEYKLIQFALSKGYERDLITDALKANML